MEDRPWTQRAAIALLRVILIVIAGLGRERLKLRAAALTYVTLLSFVPALAVMYAVLSALGGTDSIREPVEDFVNDALGGNEVILNYVDRFVTGAHAGALGGVGSVILLMGVISLLYNIERAFNDIWGIRRHRSWLQRFQVYWPLISLGPLMLGLGLSVTAGLEGTQGAALVSSLAPWLPAFAKIISFASAWVFFALLYVVMPNTRVPWLSAWVGGGVAAFCWMVAQKLYAIYTVRAVSYSAIYGSLGAIPLFIVWIYFSWVIALLGATLTFALGSQRRYEPQHLEQQEFAEKDRIKCAFVVLVEVMACFDLDKGALSLRVLQEALPVPARLLQQTIDDLIAFGVLMDGGGREGDALLLQRAPEKILLKDVVLSVRTESPRARQLDPWSYGALGASELIESRIQRGIELELGDASLRTWVRSLQGGST